MMMGETPPGGAPELPPRSRPPSGPPGDEPLGSRPPFPPVNTPPNNPMSRGPTNKKEEGKDWLSHVPTVFLWLLLVLMLAGIGVAIGLNIGPFVKMASLMLGKDQGQASSFPVISWLMSTLKVGAAYVVGITWYAISQALELAPTLLTASDKRTLRMINAVLDRSPLQISGGESTEMRWLKNKYNNRPIASIQFFRACRLFVYTMELVICWITHPPVQGSPIDFVIALATLNFSEIDWGNVGITLSVLFLVEILVRIVLHIIAHIHADRELAKAEKEGAR